jgi:small redox-active disulfide protein 2
LDEEELMKIEILSAGCATCNKLFDSVRQMVNQKGIEAEVTQVEDMQLFRKYGVFMLPAIVVDGEVKAAGKVPSESELLCWLTADE